MINSKQIIERIDSLLGMVSESGGSKTVSIGSGHLLLQNIKPEDLGGYKKEDLEVYLIKDVKKAIRLLSNSSLAGVTSKLDIVFSPPKKGEQQTPGGYASLFDVIYIYPYAYISKKSFLPALLHEIGHRYWYRFMDTGERNVWIEYIKGSTDTLSDQELKEIEALLKKSWDAAEKIVPDLDTIPLDGIYAQMSSMISDLSDETAAKLAFFFFHLQNPELFPYSDDTETGIVVSKKQKNKAIRDFMSDIQTFKFWTPGVSWYSNRNPAEAWAEVFRKYYLGRPLPYEVRREFKTISKISPVTQKALPGTEGYESLKKALVTVIKKIKQSAKWLLSRHRRRKDYGILPVSGPSTQPPLYPS
jgi:hypothetical protein